MAPDPEQPVGLAVSGWDPPSRPTLSRIEGRYCTLERLDPERHTKLLFEAFQLDPSGSDWTYLPYGPFEHSVSFHDWATKIAADSDPLFYTILDGTAQPTGMASFLRINPMMGSIEVGHIHFAQSLQRTQAATEVMYLMMRHAFDDLGYRRYEWKCDDLHVKSRAAAIRLGFTYEGTHRQARIYKGRNRDTAWYSIIDTEWPRLRNAFEAWLDPSNFDALGVQKTSLAARK